MSNLLQQLNKYRKKTKPKRKAKRKSAPGSTPKQDLALPKEQSGYKTMAEHQRLHEEDEQGNSQCIMPVAKAFKKGKFKDYRPGKVKVYTKAEIAEYERERSND